MWCDSSRAFAPGDGAGNNPQKTKPMQDLFDTPELLPANVQEIVNRYSEKLINGDGDGYTVCAEFVAELETVGYTCDYYLDAEPFNLQKL